MTLSGSARRLDRLSALGVAAAVGVVCVACSGSSGKSTPSPSGGTASIAMRQWAEGGYAVQVPAGWASVYTNYGGSYSFWTITSPDGLEFAKVTVDSCSGCILGTQYEIDIANGLHPTPNADGYVNNVAHNTGGVVVNPREVTYKSSPSPGTIKRGVMLVSHGYETAVDVQLTMKVSDSALADQIIASVKEAP